MVCTEKEIKVGCQENKKMEAIVFDYAKNYSIPNSSTNDVYYKHHLSVFMFNIHMLSTGQCVYYFYSDQSDIKVVTKCVPFYIT